MYDDLLYFCSSHSDEKPKPPTEPAPLPKENPNVINEDDAPWRRPPTIRPQPESPPKSRELTAH